MLPEVNSTLNIYLFEMSAIRDVLIHACWLGLLTCKNHLPYNLYCVGGDVKHCTIQSLPIFLVEQAWPPVVRVYMNYVVSCR